MTKQKSKVSGESKDEATNQQLAMQSSKEALTPKQEDQTTSATLENSQNQTSQIGFQPTKNLIVDERTANVNIIMAFSTKLGSLVVWKKFLMEDGSECIALAFPLDKWEVASNGSLKPKEENEES